MPEEASAAELSYQDVINRQKDIADEVERIASRDQISSDDEQYLRKLETDWEDLDSVRRKKEARAFREKVDAATGKPLTIDRGHQGLKDLDDDPFNEPIEDRKYKNPFNLDEMRRLMSPSEEREELRARALSAVEQMRGANDDTRKTMTEIIEKWDDGRSTLARFALYTGSPDYLRAFTKAAKSPQNPNLTPREVDAVERAMSLTDSAGGFLVPFQLDATVINTTAGTYNEIRRAARQVVATGDTWNGVSAGATSWSWDAEAAQASDDASTFAQPSITIHKGVGFVPISLEALQDEANVANEVGRLLAAGKDNLEATAFATGSGSGQPFGVVTALSTTANVSATTNNSFGLPDVYLLDESLPARHRPNASWLAHRAIYNDIRQFDTAGGAALWERLGADVPPLLLGRNAYEAEAMDGSLGTGDDYALVFGNFEHYVIADRIGMTVEFIPHLFSTNAGRPTGQRGWFAYYRVGADVVYNGAFKLLVV